MGARRRVVGHALQRAGILDWLTRVVECPMGYALACAGFDIPGHPHGINRVVTIPTCGRWIKAPADPL